MTLRLRNAAVGVLIVIGLLASGVALAACGDEDDDDEPGVVGGERQAQDTGGEGPQLTGADLGEQVFADEGCNECHVIARQGGTGHGIGPALGGVFGSQVALEDGSKVKANAAYMRRAIADPDAEIVQGFEEGTMSSVVPPGSISSENVDALVAYIRTLR